MPDVYVVNVADSQSISLETGLRIKRDRGNLTLVSYVASSAFPEAGNGEVTVLGAPSWRSPRAALALWRLLRRENPHIVHLHNGFSVLVGTVLGRLAGASIVKTEHNDHRFQKLSERVINILVFPFCHAIACNSEATRRSFSGIERLLAGARVRVIHNGLDLDLVDAVIAEDEDRAATRAAFGLAPGDVVFGTACRFVPQKNLDRLIDAFALVHARRPDTALALVGSGPLLPELVARVGRLGLEGRVHFLGARPRASVYRFMRCVDVVAIPSLWEGFCNAAVEALAVGTPLLAADIQTLREVLQGHARFVDPGSAETIAQGLLSLAEMPAEERPAKTAAAAAFARSTYALATTSRMYGALYDELGSLGAVDRRGGNAA